jgi:hopanoid biosynthesis associated RND transporter like protein HpnN
LAAALACALGDRRYQSPWPELPHDVKPGDLATGYLLAKEGRLGLVLLRPAPGKESFVRDNEAIDSLRERIAGVQERHPSVRIGLTGLPVLENDEMRSSSADMLWASLLSFAGVALLFVVGFGGWRHALLANLVLLLGMAWSFGYVTLAVGHLNILSMSFTVTLIGIGIDYGIHYVARYLQRRRDGDDCHAALLATSRGIGPAIGTGAITTAVSFFAAAFTSFTGIAELGLIAGSGILLCAVAQLFVLPAVLLLVDRAGWSGRLPEPLPVQRWLGPIFQRPRLALTLALAATVVLLPGLGRLRYDHNLLNMQADGLESVQLERKLLTECGRSVWYALSVSDSREELLARKERLLQLPSVERTEEIVSLLPTDAALKQPIIERIQEQLANLPERAQVIPVDHPQDLERVVSGAGRLAAAGLVSPRCAAHVQHVGECLRRLPPAECYAALSQFQQQMADDLLERLHALEGMADPRWPQWSDLPDALVQRFVGRNDRHLLKIYGRGDLWDMQALSRFVADVRSVDPLATGNPLLTYEASREMKRGYELAALYAAILIFGVLLLDFRDIRLAVLAATPLGIGTLQMFGLLGWLDVPLNPANLIVLPLILGIGIDYGVHIVHEYAAGIGPYRVSASTAVAVLIDALTTIVGFGSLMIATHQGLVGLGRVLTIGVACCLFTSLILLPALLAWLSREVRGPREEQRQDVAKTPRRRAAPFKPVRANAG